MCMSGARIGMGVIAVPPRRILRVLIIARTACTVVVVGAITRGAVALRIGTTTRPPFATTTSVCVLPNSSSQKERETNESLWMLCVKGGIKAAKRAKAMF